MDRLRPAQQENVDVVGDVQVVDYATYTISFGGTMVLVDAVIVSSSRRADPRSLGRSSG